MSWFEALVLGIVQGLTEYLPVSSSGHLAIGSALFGIQGEENLAFTIVVYRWYPSTDDEFYVVLHEYHYVVLFYWFRHLCV